MTAQGASSAQTAHEKWFAVTVKPNHEARVAQGLDVRGIGHFLPVCEVHREHKRCDRRTLRDYLFPGYVLCRMVQAQRSSVLQTPGIRSIVGFGGQGTPIPEEEVERVKAMIASGLGVQSWPYLAAGHRVRVERGPLRGMDGLIVTVKNDWRLVVSVTLLQRSVAVAIDRDLVIPVSN